MAFTAEFLSLLLLVASAAALGLSIVVDVGRVSAERARATVLQRQIDKKKASLKEWATLISSRSAELGTLRMRANEATNRKQRLQAELKALEYTKVEMVHEVGDCDGAALGYWSLLTAGPGFAEAERRDVVFARPIWEYRNCAHIWAGSEDHAQGLLRMAFPPRCGVQPTTPTPLTPDKKGGAGA